MSKPPRSRWSNFVHDLVTVDFHQTDIYTGVRVAIILTIVIVLGLFTGHAAASGMVFLGTAYVLIIDLVLVLNNRSKGTRTRVLLTVSTLYSSIFAIGMVISISDNLVVPLCGLGLFIIAYFSVYPTAFWTIFFASLMFVIAIAYQGATPALAGQNFLLIFVGGLWAIVGGIIFLPRKTSKQQRTVTADPIQEQPQPQLTWQDRFRPLTSNLSVHSKHFQYAIFFAITGTVGMLIIQLFDLSEGEWVLITVWLLFLLFLIFTITCASFVKMTKRNYAFFVIFMTVTLLLFEEISFPTPDPTAAPLERIQNIFIGCVLSLVASSIWITFSRKKSNLSLGRKGE